METVCTILILACALVLVVFGGAVLTSLAAWYVTMFKMFGSWFGPRIRRMVSVHSHGKTAVALHLTGSGKHVDRHAH